MNGDAAVAAVSVPLPLLLLASLVAVCVVALLYSRRGKSVWRGPLVKGPAKQSQKAGTARDESKPRVLILFGTQTGTAERFSKQLKAELSARYGDGNNYDVMDVELLDFEAQLPKETLVLLMLATYGDGEPTDNAADFYTWLLRCAQEVKSGEADCLLKGVDFGVFGLGNKQYEHFCAVGKRTHEAMVTLGAMPVVPQGTGDDDEDIEADFEVWRTGLYAALDKSDRLVKAKAPVAAAASQIFAAESLAAYEVEVLTGAAAAGAEGAGAVPASPRLGSRALLTARPNEFYPARVLAVRELHRPGSDRSCLHVELSLDGLPLSYEAGDHVGVLPENAPGVVEQAAALLGVPLDTVIRLSVPEGNPHQLSQPFTGAVTLQAALARYTDLLSPVRKPALQALAAHASGDSGARLRHLLSPEGASEYKEWHMTSRSLLEVLQEFHDVRIPLGTFFGSVAQRLQTRFYSISSSPRAHAGQLHITCAVVREVTATGRTHEGVCSYTFRRAVPSDTIPIMVRRSTLRLPPAPTAPVVMVGPGSGLAPFRGFLHELRVRRAAGETLGPAWLFFGCRRAAQDYIYQDELESFVADGTLSRLYVAFSRDGPAKDYVQNHLASHAVEVVPLLRREGGYFYVCGDAKHMAKDVHRALAEAVASVENIAALAAEAAVKDVADAGRYQKDVW